MSGSAVYRVAHPTGRTSYLKISPNPNDPEFHAEYLRLQWLEGRLPVPAVEAYTSDDSHTYLLLSQVPGLMSCDPFFERDIPALANALAEGIRMVQSVSITDCPFHQTAATQIARAKTRAEAGLVDVDDFDERFQGKPISDVITFMEILRPTTEDLAFTHGDYCLPNILLDPTTCQITGFIDLSRAGIADRYQDITLAARSLRHNFGPDSEQHLWNALKLDKPDHDKLSFYLALDEFF